MGGSAFTQAGADGPALLTPRLKPQIYLQLRDYYRIVLKTLYSEVLTATETPKKLDHGDIDFIVAMQGDCQPPTQEMLISVLNARRCLRSGPTMNLAVPLPASSLEFSNNEPSEEPMPKSEPMYIQVDIHLCSAEDSLQWLNFHQSYGDIWMILGSIIRPYGLTANDKGFYVRCSVDSTLNLAKDKTMIFLTSDPVEAMEVLGLDIQAYNKGYESEEQIFEWLVGSCLFDEGVLDREQGQGKSRDRSKMRKREMYRRFWKEWLPCHVLELERKKRLVQQKKIAPETAFDGAIATTGPISNAEMTLRREDVLKDALDRFNVRPQYASLMEGCAQNKRKRGLFPP